MNEKGKCENEQALEEDNKKLRQETEKLKAELKKTSNGNFFLIAFFLMRMTWRSMPQSLAVWSLNSIV